MDAEVGKAKTVDGTVSFKLGSYRTAFLATYQILPRFTTTADITTTPTPTPTPTPTTPKLEFKEIKPNSGSPFLIATGTAANIPEGSYEVLITTDSDTDGVTKTIDVDADNKFEVSLYELMLGARGELVTVRTTATAGRYRDISFTFTSPTMTADFDDAIDSEGSVTFTVGTDFDTIRPTVALKAGNAVTGYSNISTIANGTFTATYTTSIASGTFIPEGTITIEGTDFTFTGNTVTASS